MKFENRVKWYIDRTNQTPHKIAQLSGIPYTTIVDLYNDKNAIENSKYITLYRLAKCLRTRPSCLCRKVKEK